MPALNAPQGNIFTDSLPAPLKALIEALMPPDSLGIDPGSSMMPVSPILGALSKMAPKGKLVPPGGFLDLMEQPGQRIAQMADVPTPQSMPSMPEVDDLLAQLGSSLSQIPSKGSAAGHGIPDMVPVGGEAAFNALRTPNLGRAVQNVSPMRSTLDEITGEVGPQGLREMMQRPIPGRQVPRPPR